LNIFSLLLIFAAFGSAFCSSKEISPYEMLRNIKSPQQLLFPHLPDKYCVEVVLGGSIANEMNKTLKSLDLETPVYKESFDGNGFSLSVANKNYPLQTRDLLSGILNPVEFIDITVGSVLKYKSTEQYREIVNNTRINYSSVNFDGRAALVFRLTPKGDRFAYSYNDNGAFVQESWMSDMRIIKDSALNIVYEIDFTKLSRTFSNDNLNRPGIDTAHISYLFTYYHDNGYCLPSKLSMSLDGSLILEISANYKKQKDKFVFDNKEICSYKNGTKSCLVVQYGTYELKSCQFEKQISDKKYSIRLEKASELAKKASDELRKGNITASMRVLEKIVSRYRDTPQAVEADKLLSQIPSGPQ
jgi:hypothetical protein